MNVKKSGIEFMAARSDLRSATKVGRQSGFHIGQRGEVVVSYDDDFTVVELSEDQREIGVGDTVFGDWHALGRESIRKGAENDAFDGYYQGLWGTCDDTIRVTRKTSGG